ncbi:hypothetical protein GA829_04080 [Mesorhizobium sp. INR15]|nr:hypothetical protein GA829_04080 [Mesorhizobium sp. INR15]
MCQPDQAIFISLKHPGSSAYGVAFEGNPYRAYANMPVRKDAGPDDTAWITAEGWDGSFHQGTIALEDASPVTAHWLRRHGASMR